MRPIDELLADHQPLHSDFQIDWFITVHDNWTAWGQYRQALRELDKRHRGIADLQAERELLVIDIEEMESQAPDNQFDRRRQAVKLRQKLAALAGLDRTIAENERELQRFHRIASDLRDELGELTPERRAELERETWRTRLRANAAVDLITRGRLSESTIKLLASTPTEFRRPLLAEVSAALRNQDHGLIQWFETQENSVTDTAPCLCAANS